MRTLVTIHEKPETGEFDVKVEHVTNLYRELNAGEVALLNKLAEKESELLGLIGALYALHDVDNRWIANGQTQIQFGFMALKRAVVRADESMPTMVRQEPA